MARMNINVLGISELKWTEMGKFNSDDRYIYYLGQESLRRNGVALIVNKRVQNGVLGSNLKNERMVSAHFHNKSFQYHSNPSLYPKHSCWRSWSSTVLWRPTKSPTTNTPNICSFHHRGLKCKSKKSRDTWGNRKVWPWSTKWSRGKANSFFKRTHWS